MWQIDPAEAQLMPAGQQFFRRRLDQLGGAVLRNVVDRKGEPFLGTGEAAQGPTPAAIGNAIRSATGVRLTDLPFTPDHLRVVFQG